MSREDTIQRLLRHAFVCSQNVKCNCSKLIQEFLHTDTVSLEWAEEAKKPMTQEDVGLQ